MPGTRKTIRTLTLLLPLLAAPLGAEAAPSDPPRSVGASVLAPDERLFDSKHWCSSRSARYAQCPWQHCTTADVSLSKRWRWLLCPRKSCTTHSQMIQTTPELHGDHTRAMQPRSSCHTNVLSLRTLLLKDPFSFSFASCPSYTTLVVPMSCGVLSPTTFLVINRTRTDMFAKQCPCDALPCLKTQSYDTSKLFIRGCERLQPIKRVGTLAECDAKSINHTTRNSNCRRRFET